MDFRGDFRKLDVWNWNSESDGVTAAEIDGYGMPFRLWRSTTPSSAMFAHVTGETTMDHKEDVNESFSSKKVVDKCGVINKIDE
jgi:hypothetical protein